MAIYVLDRQQVRKLDKMKNINLLEGGKDVYLTMVPNPPSAFVQVGGVDESIPKIELTVAEAFRL